MYKDDKNPAKTFQFLFIIIIYKEGGSLIFRITTLFLPGIHLWSQSKFGDSITHKITNNKYTHSKNQYNIYQIEVNGYIKCHIYRGRWNQLQRAICYKYSLAYINMNVVEY